MAVERISLFKTSDGKTFVSEKEANQHEVSAVIELGVNALLVKSKLETAAIDNPNSDDIVFLSAWLVANRDDLLIALGGAVAKKTRTPKAERTPRAKKDTVTIDIAQPTVDSLLANVTAKAPEKNVLIEAVGVVGAELDAIKGAINTNITASAELDALVQEVEHGETTPAEAPAVTMSETDELLAMLTEEAN